MAPQGVVFLGINTCPEVCGQRWESETSTQAVLGTTEYKEWSGDFQFLP